MAPAHHSYFLGTSGLPTQDLEPGTEATCLPAGRRGAKNKPKPCPLKPPPLTLYALCDCSFCEHANRKNKNF